MRTLHRNYRRTALGLALSMSVMPNLVNAQSPSLTSINNANSSTTSELKDSAKESRPGFAELIEAVLRTGADGNVGINLAPVIGLPKPMPYKTQQALISKHDKDQETRAYYVIYENTESTASKAAEKQAICAYIVRVKRSGLDRQMRYFRTDLNGKLEKVVLSESKLDDAGKGVLGSGVATDQDIDSSEVKKTFEAEMKFWLKDWLKKEQKSPSKKTAEATKPNLGPAAL